MKKIYVVALDDTPAVSFESKQHAEEYAEDKFGCVKELLLIERCEYPSDKPHERNDDEEPLCSTNGDK